MRKTSVLASKLFIAVISLVQSANAQQADIYTIDTLNDRESASCGSGFNKTIHPINLPALEKRFKEELALSGLGNMGSTRSTEATVIGILDTGLAGWDDDELKKRRCTLASGSNCLFAPFKRELSYFNQNKRVAGTPEFGNDIYGTNLSDEAGLRKLGDTSLPTSDESIAQYADPHGTEMAVIALGGWAAFTREDYPFKLKLKIVNLAYDGDRNFSATANKTTRWDLETRFTKGFRYLATEAPDNNYPRVINISLGTDLNDRKIEQLLFNTINPLQSRAISVVAAGNHGKQLVNTPAELVIAGGVTKAVQVFPALLGGRPVSTLITVGAYNPVLKKRLASSNYSGKYVDIFAPGCGSETRTFSGEPNKRSYFNTFVGGTSVAAATTSFVAGLIMHLDPDLSAAIVKNRLIVGGDYDAELEKPDADGSKKAVFGYVLNPAKAISIHSDVVDTGNGLKFISLTDFQVASLSGLCKKDRSESPISSLLDDLAIRLLRIDKINGTKFRFLFEDPDSRSIYKRECEAGPIEADFRSLLAGTHLEAGRFRDLVLATSLIRN